MSGMSARKKSSSSGRKNRTGQNSAYKNGSPAASRPYMPGYGLPTHDKGMLPWKYANGRLSRSRNYFLATTRPDGSPHVMPIWGIWVDSIFYFSTGRESRKARNLAANAHCVVCTDRAEAAAILEGVSEQVSDTSLLKKLDAPYHKKYKPWHLDPKMGPVFAVRPRVVFGLDEKKTLNSATRWKFL